MRKLLYLILLILSIQVKAGDTAHTYRKKILTWTALSGTATGVQVVLHEAWYRDYHRIKFHWANDNKNWLQMDKAGHAFSTSFLTSVCAKSFKAAGYSQKQSAVFGFSVALAFQSAIEYSDGLSDGWGASSGDLLANFAGGLFAGAQQYLWGEIKVPFSITFQNNKLAAIRPNVLGNNLPQHLLKNYNSQTYWLSFIPSKIKASSRFPHWLGFSLGYGINGCLGAVSNTWTDNNGSVYDYSQTPRIRQFYFSPDFALGRIKTKNRTLRFLLKLTDYWKLPAPALVFENGRNIKFNWLYW